MDQKFSEELLARRRGPDRPPTRNKMNSNLRKPLLWSRFSSTKDGLHIFYAHAFDLWHNQGSHDNHNSTAHREECKDSPWVPLGRDNGHDESYGGIRKPL